jgi:hypothetical protein
MNLPGRVLEAKTRAVKMGAFHTVDCVAMLIGPSVGGRMATSRRTAGAALDVGALVLHGCPLLLWGFRQLSCSATSERRPERAPEKEQRSDTVPDLVR